MYFLKTTEHPKICHFLLKCFNLQISKTEDRLFSGYKKKTPCKPLSKWTVEIECNLNKKKSI